MLSIFSYYKQTLETGIFAHIIISLDKFFKWELLYQNLLAVFIAVIMYQIVLGKISTVWYYILSQSFTIKKKQDS